MLESLMNDKCVWAAGLGWLDQGLIGGPLGCDALVVLDN